MSEIDLDFCTSAEKLGVTQVQQTNKRKQNKPIFFFFFLEIATLGHQLKNANFMVQAKTTIYNYVLFFVLL